MHDGLRIAKHVEHSHASESVLELRETDLALVARVRKLLHPLLEVDDVDVLEV